MPHSAPARLAADSSHWTHEHDGVPSSVIRSFASRATSEIYGGRQSRTLATDIQDSVRRKLRMRWSNTTEDRNVRRLRNVHPGEVLKEEFLEPLHVSSHRLAQATGIGHTAIADIIQERGRITADAALRLAKFFGTTPRFWMGLQDDYDLEERQTAIADELEAIPSVS